MQAVDPFSALGLAPTLDRELIKRSYFAAVRSSPPHADPEAFRRLRAAYEQLNDGARLMQAWLQAPLDVDNQLERWSARFQSRIDVACAAERGEARTARAVELLIDRCTRTPMPGRPANR